MAIFAVFAHYHLFYVTKRTKSILQTTISLQSSQWLGYFFPIQGDKFYIELYGGSVVVTKKLDYESINNYTLKILAKVGRVSLTYKRILGHLNNNNKNKKSTDPPTKYMSFIPKLDLVVSRHNWFF